MTDFMPRILYIDCFSGASGDMLLGALVSLGYPLEELNRIVSALGLDGEVSLVRDTVQRGGLKADRVQVLVSDHGHPRRSWKEIHQLIQNSALTDPVKSRSLGAFERLAACEADIHGVPVDQVHFHEMSGADTLVDIVGVTAGMAWLAPDRVDVSPVNVGTGTVACAHGVLPVPAPATAALLTGVPVYGLFDGELTTPTGALLITEFATGFGPMPLMAATRIACSAGTRESGDHPNVLRMFLGRAANDSAGDFMTEEIFEIQTGIDDMNPQVYPYVIDRLLAAGARDAFVTPVVMKKGRPGHLLHVLCSPDERDAALDILLHETTTLGARIMTSSRVCLDRCMKSVDTEYGAIAIKIGVLGGLVVNVMPEYEDCAAAARAAGVPLQSVMAAAGRAAQDRWKPGHAMGD